MKINARKNKPLKDMCYIFLLKLNGINLISFKLQRQQCSTAGNDFLFKEIPVEGFYIYEHNDSGMYLTCSCGDRKARLTLIRSSNRHKDRKIRFARSTRI